MSVYLVDPHRWAPGLYDAAGFKGSVNFGVPAHFEQCQYCERFYERWASDYPPPGFCSVPCHDMPFWLARSQQTYFAEPQTTGAPR